MKKYMFGLLRLLTLLTGALQLAFRDRTTRSTKTGRFHYFQ